jgi:hypothetical protein
MKNRNSRFKEFSDAMVARGWSRAEVFALVQLNRSAAQREQFRDLNPPQTAAGPSDEAAVAPEAAAPAPATSARAPPVAPSHLVGDGPTYMCLFDGCGKMYSSTDSARKHCRQRHTAWLRSRDQRLGTRAYCMPIGEHT